MASEHPFSAGPQVLWHFIGEKEFIGIFGRPCTAVFLIEDELNLWEELLTHWEKTGPAASSTRLFDTILMFSEDLVPEEHSFAVGLFLEQVLFSRATASPIMSLGRAYIGYESCLNSTDLILVTNDEEDDATSSDEDGAITVPARYVATGCDSVTKLCKLATVTGPLNLILHSDWLCKHASPQSVGNGSEVEASDAEMLEGSYDKDRIAWEGDSDAEARDAWLHAEDSDIELLEDGPGYIEISD
ncbi:hypothetical protein M407DRAFT_24765 [Tulasnella calospora MUT 4182]|uniref:Uncharacterized protein n=1 Tax=Tulasnella calospora MUT 4182 TaxID=1051891 RepID=A0A0C3QHB8_9AGAM|nr:hypothetical protein M407DRAFT_24765 [Tulasnella calospora MUT 4182]